jgi:acyl-CoA thioesterase II
VTVELGAARGSVVERVTLAATDRPDAFIGRPVPTLRGTMFGGQIIGQTLAAAIATVDRHPWPVSLQLYFIAAPEMDTDIVYRVERRRDGGRYAWRHVLATQGDRIVVEAIAAFGSRPVETGPAPHPLGVPIPADRDGSMAAATSDQARLDDYFRLLTMDMLDIRFVTGSPPRRISAGDLDPSQEFWVRPLGGGEWNLRDVSAALALLSDVNMLAMPLLALGEVGDLTGTYALSFDHNLRFYSTQPELGWLLCRQESVVVAGTTVEARALVYAPDGRLVFTANQQGVVVARTSAGAA